MQAAAAAMGRGLFERCWTPRYGSQAETVSLANHHDRAGVAVPRSKPGICVRLSLKTAYAHLQQGWRIHKGCERMAFDDSNQSLRRT